MEQSPSQSDHMQNLKMHIFFVEFLKIICTLPEGRDVLVFENSLSLVGCRTKQDVAEFVEFLEVYNYHGFHVLVQHGEKFTEMFEIKLLMGALV